MLETLGTLGFLLAVTAVSVWLHLRGRSRDRGADAEAAAACPRCGASIDGGAKTCSACGVPQQLFEVVRATTVPETRIEAVGSTRRHAVVRADLCVGCGTCVAACPEPGALSLVGKVARVDLDRCAAHGSCEAACPVGAIRVGEAGAAQRVRVPELGADFQTSVPGVHVVGELGGRGLIKNAVNEGKFAVECIARDRLAAPAPPDPRLWDLVIVGAGPAGLSAGLEAKRAGLRAVLLEQGTLADTIRKYPRRKLLLAEPVRVPLYGDLWIADAEKETLLGIWESLVRSAGLDVREHHKVDDVSRIGALLEVHAAGSTFRARHVVLAMGRRGIPRKLGVPGEELEKVLYDVVEMDVFRGRRVLVVGGGDSAVESALGLANQDGCEIVLSYRGDALSRVKPRNLAKLDARVAEGRIRLLFGSVVREIREGAVLLDVRGTPLVLPNDDVIVRAGGEAPYAFLEKIGVRIVQKDVPLGDAKASVGAA